MCEALVLFKNTTGVAVGDNVKGKVYVVCKTPIASLTHIYNLLEIVFHLLWTETNH